MYMYVHTYSKYTQSLSISSIIYVVCLWANILNVLGILTAITIHRFSIMDDSQIWIHFGVNHF